MYHKQFPSTCSFKNTQDSPANRTNLSTVQTPDVKLTGLGMGWLWTGVAVRRVRFMCYKMEPMLLNGNEL